MRKSSRMAPKEKQTIEIEKTHRDPLLSFNQAVTVDCSDFLGTALTTPNYSCLRELFEEASGLVSSTRDEDDCLNERYPLSRRTLCRSVLIEDNIPNHPKENE